eukprot:m.358716 g.358716  ORF g.358716 m.358716 type:complete len:129 (+) comp18252_c0_seq1:71-457(+)
MTDQPEAIVASQEGMADQNGDTLSSLSKDMFEKLGACVSHDLQTSCQEYALLQRMNEVAQHECETMQTSVREAHGHMDTIQQQYAEMQSKFAQVDELCSGIDQLNDVVQQLDTYSKQLETRFKEISRR